MNSAELDELVKAILDDEVAVDFESVRRACPYKFRLPAPTPTNTLTLKRFYTLGHFFSRLVALIELTHRIGPNTKHHLIKVNRTLKTLERTSDHTKMERLLNEARRHLKEAARSLTP